MSRIYLLLGIVIAVPSLIVGVFFYLLANPDYYKPRLEATFKSEVGFELDIRGAIGWRYWPPIALNICDVKVRPIDAVTPLASIKSASIDLQLWPLLTGNKNISIDGISIDGLTINAIVDKNGKANWESPKSANQPVANWAWISAGST